MTNIGKRQLRNTDLDQLVREAMDSGLDCTYNFMFGLPGETESDFEQVLDFLKRSGKYLTNTTPSFQCCRFSRWTLTPELKKSFGIEIPIYVEYGKPSPRYDHWRCETGKNTLPLRVERRTRFIEAFMQFGPQKIEMGEKEIQFLNKMAKQDLDEYERLQGKHLEGWI